MDINKLQALKINELTKVAQELKVQGYSGLTKQDLILQILLFLLLMKGKQVIHSMILLKQ